MSTPAGERSDVPAAAPLGEAARGIGGAGGRAEDWLASRAQAAWSLAVRGWTRVTDVHRPPGRWLRGWRGLTLTVIVLAGLAWPHLSVLAVAGLDNSWAIGVSLAVSRGISFGNQVVFTYGPLGLVYVPLAVTPGTLALGIVGALALQLTLATMLVRSLRRRLPIVLAALIALVALLITVAAGLPTLEVIAFGAVALTLSAPRERIERAAVTLAIAGGAFAGLALLVKLNDGIATGLIIAVGLLGAPGVRRNLALGAAAFVLTTVLAWVALGQPLGGLPEYIRYSSQVVVGYVDAMGFDALGVNGQWEVPVVITSAIALSVGAWITLERAPLRRRAALAVAVVLVHYFVAREMFVRYEPGHAAAINLLVLVALMIPWRRGQFATGLAMASAVAIAALAVLALDGVGLSAWFDPTARASALIDQVGTTFSPGAQIAQGRAQIVVAEGIPSTFYPQLDGHCVSAEPGEIAAIFANPSWRWCPIGVMQSYVAETTALDELDAAGYANARTGPDRVLRQLNETIDQRNPTWDSPAAQLSLLCHFVEVDAAEIWQVLARIPDRCGKPRQIAVLHTAANGVLTLPAPPPGMVVIAKIYGLQIHRGERLETLFVRPAERVLVVNAAKAYRVPPDTLGDGLILDVPEAADDAPPFNFNNSVSELEADIGSNVAPFSVALIGVPIKPNPILK